MIDLYRKMRHVVRRLYLRDDPKSHFKEDWTILFHTNKSVKIFFWSISFLQITCLLRPLRRNAEMQEKCKPLDKDQSDFFHKDFVRVYQKQNLALS